ncbi:thioredoxin domain-containing protein [Kytococcus aerolatus]|uniref:thioredoxin domain-containing protein n=1 Tax=Kytococcus aerolatus TaxID=592308 RepID=UPI0013588DCE|nr:thioredoxin family protein [Kytococcus aerolatus]
MTDETFEPEVAAADVAVVVITDEFCDACQEYHRALQQVADTMDGEAAFFDVTAQSAPQVFASSGVTTWPTTVIFREGMLLHLESGVYTAENLEQLVRLFAEADIEEMRQAVTEQGTTVIGAD